MHWVAMPESAVLGVQYVSCKFGYDHSVVRHCCACEDWLSHRERASQAAEVARGMREVQ